MSEWEYRKNVFATRALISKIEDAIEDGTIDEKKAGLERLAENLEVDVDAIIKEHADMRIPSTATKMSVGIAHGGKKSVSSKDSA